MRTKRFNDPIPPLELFPLDELEFELEWNAPKEAYIMCPSRGDWWKDEKACGEAGAVGKKLDMGEDGGEL